MQAYFSFKKGKAIAQIVYTKPYDYPKAPGKKQKKQNDILYVSDKPDSNAQNDIIFSNNKHKYAGLAAIDEVRSSILNRRLPRPELADLYSSIVNETKQQRDKTFLCENCTLYPVPDLEGRQCIYVAGPSGSGKSTYVYYYAENYLKTHPDSTIFLFSRVESDIFDGLDNLQRISLDNQLIEHEINANDFKDCLVIFDDTDTILDDKLRKYVVKIKNDILEIGRHNNTYCAITSHLITSYKDTRTVLNECHAITVFPHGGGTDQITYALTRYFGLTKKQVICLLKLNSRWVTVLKNYPQLVFYEKGAYFLT